MLILNRPTLFSAPYRDKHVEYPSNFVENLHIKYIPDFAQDVTMEYTPTFVENLN
jgi:hypothetical protein